jgi:hypothetical protein
VVPVVVVATREMTVREKKDSKAENNMFFMALALSTTAIVSRLLLYNNK